MKSLGIVRAIDSVGRVVLPIEMRKELDLLKEDSKIEIFAQGNEIVMRKYVPTCIFCHSDEMLKEFNGQKVCKACVERITKLCDD